MENEFENPFLPDEVNAAMGVDSEAPQDAQEQATAGEVQQTANDKPADVGARGEADSAASGWPMADVMDKSSKAMDQLRAMAEASYQARECMKFLQRTRSTEYQQDEGKMREACRELERNVFGFESNDGSQWNLDHDGKPLSPKKHADVLKGVIEKQFDAVRPEGYDEWEEVKAGGDIDEECRVAGIDPYEYKWTSSGMSMNGSIATGGGAAPMRTRVRRSEDDIRADLAKYDAKMNANKFMFMYRAIRPDLSDEAKYIVDGSIMYGLGLRDQDVTLFNGLSGEERLRVAHLIQASRMNTKDLSTDVAVGVGNLVRSMGEGTSMFVQDALLPNNVLEKMTDEVETRIRAGEEPLSDEERAEIAADVSGKDKNSFRVSHGGVLAGENFTAVQKIAYRHAMRKFDSALLQARKDRDAARRSELEIRRLTERRQYDRYNFAENAILGAVTTLPYMAEAAIPVVGTPLVIMQQFEGVKDQLIEDGYNPTTESDAASTAQFALATAYALIEKLEFGAAFGKPLTALQFKTLMHSTATTAFRKVMDVGGRLTREAVATTLWESVGEGLQGGIEKGTISWMEGNNWEKIVKDAANGVAGDFVDSLGTMGVIALFGTGMKARRAVTQGNDSESVAEFASRQLKINNMVSDAMPKPQHHVSEARAAKTQERRDARAKELVQKAAEIWRSNEDRAKARDEIEDLTGLDEGQTRMLCEWLADRDTLIENMTENSDLGRDLMAAYGTDNVMEALYRHGRDGHWEQVRDFFKEHYLSQGLSEEEAEKQAEFQVRSEREMAAKGMSFRSPQSVFSSSKDLDPVAFMRTFINPDLKTEEGEVEIGGKKVHGTNIVIPIKQKDGTVKNYRMMTITSDDSAINIGSEGYATDVGELAIKKGWVYEKDNGDPILDKNGRPQALTKELWESLPIGEKKRLAEHFNMKVAGGFRFIGSDGKTSVTSNGLMQLFGKGGKLTKATENRDIAHEYVHAIVSFATDAGAINDGDAEVLRQIFGESKNSGERWNEEAMADAFRDYLQGEFDFGKFRKEHRGILQRILDAMRSFTINLLRSVGVDVGATDEERRSAVDAVWEGIRTGDFSKLREYSGIRFRDGGGELNKDAGKGGTRFTMSGDVVEYGKAKENIYDGRANSRGYGDGLASQEVQRAIAEIINSRRTSQAVLRADRKAGWEPSREITEIAKRNGCFITVDEFKNLIANDYRKPDFAGGEHQVWTTKDGSAVVKLNGFFSAVENGEEPVDVFDRYAIHNQEFKGCQYELLGFTELDRTPYLVVRQPFIMNSREATQDEIYKYFNDKEYVRVGSSSWRKNGILISDVESNNVLVDDRGYVFVIDARCVDTSSTTRLSLVTPADDAAYADAVKRGDRDTVLRMIREAAAKAGYNKEVWHYGSYSIPDVPNFGMHFGTLKAARDRSREVDIEDGWFTHGFFNANKALRLDDHGEWDSSVILGQLHSAYWQDNETRRKINSIRTEKNQRQKDEATRSLLNTLGYSGIVYQNKYEDYGKDSYIVTNPENIKSADITYDDAGNLIPLSERFNPKRSDIRYSLADDGNAGVNINDQYYAYTDDILSGKKTIETRKTDSLRAAVGHTVGIVRTGVGKATYRGTMDVGEPKVYHTIEEFDADADKHQVREGNPLHDTYVKMFADGKAVYGYPLSNVKAGEERELNSRGIVFRDIRYSLGVPYQGSKNRFATDIVNALPAGDRFVDLFAGGMAMSHAAMLSGKYRTFLANDRDGRGMDLFRAAQGGEFRNADATEAPTKEEFDKWVADGDPRALLVSFGSNGRTYAGDKAGETWRQSLNRANQIADTVADTDFAQTVGDYTAYQHREGDVVYADIPYAGTDRGAYKGGFSTERFLEWAASQNYPVFVSSYEMPAGWTDVGSFGRSSGGEERLFVQDRFAEQMGFDTGSRFSLAADDYQPKVTYHDLTGKYLYKTMRVVDGHLEYPMAGTGVPVPVDHWLIADDNSRVNPKTGKRETKLRFGSKDVGRNGRPKSNSGTAAPFAGFHMGSLPYMAHIGLGGTPAQKHFQNADYVWVAVDVPMDRSEEYRTATKDYTYEDAMRGKIPVDGMYYRKTNPNMKGKWGVAGAMKIVEVLSDDQVDEILDREIPDRVRMGRQGGGRFNASTMEFEGQDLRGWNLEEAEKEFNADVADENGPEMKTTPPDSDTGLGNGRYSLASLAEAAGFSAQFDDNRVFVGFFRDGKKKGGVTVDDIMASPLGNFIKFSVANGSYSEKTGQGLAQLFASVMNTIIKTGDAGMGQQLFGSTIFTGIKTNSDHQYGTTYDFPSICTKTQAIIDAMSENMVRLGRGLTKEEILALYRHVFDLGAAVPCPECYVFSRWIGIGGLLDHLKKYQEQFKDMTVAEVKAEYDAQAEKIMDEVRRWNADPAHAEKQIKFGKGKGKLAAKYQKLYMKQLEKVQTAQDREGEADPADVALLEQYERQMTTVNSMTWIENVYFSNPEMTKRRENFIVPDNVLFDLNNADEFATKYPQAWYWRCTQGAGYGKAITPYAEATFGEGIQAIGGSITSMIKNKKAGKFKNQFLDKNLQKKATTVIKKAIAKMKVQSFLGGQRFQSTSDARYENMTDYLLAHFEVQSMEGMVQLYTKVLTAVPFFADAGDSVNMSLMPDCRYGGIGPDGNPIDTSTGGANPTEAQRLRKAHPTAGTITIGVNDDHIRALVRQAWRDFVIPYHASGGDRDLVAAMRLVQEGVDRVAAKFGTMKSKLSTDYTTTQGDKELSDEMLRNYWGLSDAEIERVHKMREQRLAILTRNGALDMEFIRSNKFLSRLYDRFNGGEWDGVSVGKGKVDGHIFPNEFFDYNVKSEKESIIWTKDYLEYCRDLGYMHRFSGLKIAGGKIVQSSGRDRNGDKVAMQDLFYRDGVARHNKFDVNELDGIVEPMMWKVLVDRRMLDNEGRYQPQKRVDLTNVGIGDIEGFAKNKTGVRNYDTYVQNNDHARVEDLIANERGSGGRAIPAIEESFKEKQAKAKRADEINNSRYTLVSDRNGANASDYARAFVASSLMQGRSPTKSEVAKLVRGLRIPDDPDTVLADAQALAKRQSGEISEKVRKSSPNMMKYLAKGAMEERFNNALSRAIAGSAKASDPSIGIHLEQMRQGALDRALDEAHGFTQAQMKSELYVNLSAALFKVADFEKTPDQKAKLEAARLKREEERKRAEEAGENTDEPKMFDENGNLVDLNGTHERKEVPDSVKALLDDIMAGADRREERRKRKEAERKAKRDAAKKKAEEDGAADEGQAEGDQPAGGENDEGEEANVGEENIDEETFDLLKPVFSSEDQFASFIEEWVYRKLKESNPRLNERNVFRDPVNLRQLQNTAKDVLNQLAKDCLGRTDAYVVAARQIDKVMDYKYLNQVHAHVAYVYGRIHENALRINRRKLVGELVKELKKNTGARGRFKNTDEEKNRKVFAKTELWVRKLIPLLYMSSAKLDERRAELEAVINSYNTTTDEGKWEADNDMKYQEATMEYSLLQQYGGMIRWMVGDIIDCSNEILRAVSGNIQEFLMRQEIRRERNRTIRDALVAAMKEGYAHVGRTVKDTVVGRLLDKMDSEMGNIELRLKDLIKYCRDPKLKADAERAIQEIMYQLGRGTEQYNVQIAKGRREVNAMLARCYGSADAGIKHLQDELPESVKVGSKTFDPDSEIFQQAGQSRHTFGQLLQLYGSCVQQDYHDNVILHGRDKQLFKMFATLTKEDRAFHKELIDYYKRSRLELSDAVEAITGLPVRSPDSKYIPVRPLNIKDGFPASVQCWNPITASLTNRIHHGKDFDERVDILSQVNNAIEDRAHVIGYGQAGIFLRDTIAHHDVQDAARGFADKGQMGRILDQITDTLTQNKMDSNPFSIASALRQSVSLAYLSWNVVSGAKQLGSFSVWANTVGFRKMLKYMTDVNWDAVKELIDTDGYKARYELGWTPETQELLRNPNPNAIKKFLEKGMGTSRFFDRICCLWMAQGVYRDLKQSFMSELNEDGTRLYTEEEAKQRAATITWNWCEQGQQTGRTEYKTNLQRKNPLSGFVYHFMSAPLLQFNYELQAFREVYKTKGASGKAKLARAIIINHVIIPASFQLIIGLFQALGLKYRPDEPEEWVAQVWDELWHSMVLGSFNSLFMVCSFVKGVYNGITGDKFSDDQALPVSTAARFLYDGAKVTADYAKYGATELGWADFDVTIDDCLKDLNRALRDAFAPYKQADNAKRVWTGSPIIGE